MNPESTTKRRMERRAFFTPRELCERWKVTAGFISQLFSSGRLKGVKIGRCVRFYEEDVQMFERRNYGKAAA